ncbi:MAG: S1 family peptidase [Oligoflexus sp.]
MRKFSLFLTQFVFLFSLSCGKASESSLPSIYNGSIDTEHDSVGLLVLDGKLWCSASLIGQKTALSAAHCFEKKTHQPNDLYLRFNNVDVKVLEVIIHPRYGDWFGRVTHDVAVLKLENIINIPIIPLASKAPIPGETAILVGFGYTDAKLKESMDGTKRTGRSIVGKVESNRVFFPEPKDEGMSQTCKGDSGAPIFSFHDEQKTQIAIVSGSMDGKASKTCQIESYGARIDAYIEWIIETAEGDAVIAD